VSRHHVRRTVGVWFFRLLVVGAVALVWFVPPLKALSRTEDTASISSYDVQMDLSADGTLRSQETIAVDLPAGKRGIFRIFDTEDPRRPDVEHPVTDVRVTRDGETDAITWVDGASGTRTLRIGMESRFLTPGEHVYRIDSTTTGALEPGQGDARDTETLWWWDVVGSGWQMAMDQVTVTARLPATPRRAECVQGESTPCTAEVVDRTLTVRTGPLEPFTPVTVRVAFPADALPPPPGGSSELLRGVLLASGLAALVWLGFFLATRERRPGLPVLYEPPAGVTPPLGVRVLEEEDSPDDLQAVLFDLGDRGVVKLEGDDERWRIHLLVDPATADLRPAEAEVLNRLRLTTPGEWFVVSTTKTAGERIQAARDGLQTVVGQEAATYLRRSWPGGLGRFLGGAATVAVLVLAGVYFFGVGWVRWPLLAGLAVFAFLMLGLVADPSVSTKHTPEGRDLWSRTGGFARFLGTDSSEARFDAAAHLDWYPRYLGWAVALGVADEWAGRFRAQGIELPDVPYVAWSGHDRMASFSGMRDSFNSAVVGASAAYAASQASSSSGGGGGFSGGSGGGGGGGGSW
jgi:hypothetical protein